MQFVKTLAMIEVILLAGLLFYRSILSSSNKSIVDGKAIALTVATPAVALLAGNIYVLYVYIAAAIGLTSRTRIDAGRTYLLMLPMAPALTQDAVIGSLYLVPLSTGLATSLGAILAVLVTPRPPGQVRATRYAPYDLAAFSLFLLFTYIDVRGFSATAVLRLAIANAIGYAGPYLLISRAISQKSDLDRLLLSLLLPAVLVSLVAIFEASRHWILYQSFYEALNVPLPMLSATLNLRGGLLRTGGPILDYTAAGIFLAAMLVVIMHLWRHFIPGIRWILPLVVAGGLAVTQSRGDWLAAVTGVLFVFAFRGKWLWVMATLAGAICMRLVLSLVSLGNTDLAETIGTGGASLETLDYRQRLFWRGIQEIRTHPIFGQTSDQLAVSMADMVQGQHIIDFVNAHLYIAITVGVPLFILWLAIWTVPFVRGWQLRRLKGAGGNPAELTPAIILTVCVAWTATSFVDRSMTWCLIALAIAGPCYALAGRTERATRSTLRPRGLVPGLPRESSPA